MTDLENLRGLVFNGGYDAESKQEVLNLEKRLHSAMVHEKLADNPIIQEYTDYLKNVVLGAETLLKTDKTLTNEQRAELFAKIEVANKFHIIVIGEPVSQVEEEIKSLLNVAKAES